MFHVITFTGKGAAKADSVAVRAFEFEEDAKEYIKNSTTAADSKYWSYSDMLGDGVVQHRSAQFVWDTYRDYLFGSA